MGLPCCTAVDGFRLRSTHPTRSPFTHKAKSTLRRKDPTLNLVFLDRLEQRLEVSLAKAVVALPLDELEEDRADHGLGENLQQDLGCAAVDHALAVNEYSMFPHALDRLGVAPHPVEAFLVI